MNFRDNRSIRVRNLHQILLSKYLPAESLERTFETKELASTHYEKELVSVYKSLGGLAGFPHVKFSVPFLEFGRFCVLLDEAVHFNRYRAKTLRAPYYEHLKSYPSMKLRTYCRKYETECIKAGTSKLLWTNKEAECHFGPSQASGDLGLSGSSGWKLKAFEDFVIDVLSRKRKIRLLRISIWDDLMVNRRLQKFSELLMSPGKTETEAILKHVENKVIALYADDL